MRIASSSDSDTENGELGRSRSRSGSGDLEDEPSGDESCGEGVMDDLGPAMDEKALADLLKGKKRVDEKPVTLRLNKAMIDMFNLKLVGEGRWNKEAQEDMRDKYYLSQEQLESLEPASLKRTRLHMQGLDFGGLGKTMWNLHKSARDVAKVALREHEVILCYKEDFTGWGPEAAKVWDSDGHLTGAFSMPNVADTAVEEADVVKLAQEEEPKELAAQVLKHRQCLVELATKYAAIANMYTDARTAANKGADLQKFLTEMSWDLLQLLGQHDLGITDMRRWVQSSTWRLIFPVTPRPDLWFQDRHRAVPDGQVQEAAEGGDERLKDEEGARRLPLHSTQGPEPDRQGGGKV